MCFVPTSGTHLVTTSIGGDAWMAKNIASRLTRPWDSSHGLVFIPSLSHNGTKRFNFWHKTIEYDRKIAYSLDFILSRVIAGQ